MMSKQESNKEARQYYRLTEDTYRHLDAKQTSFMNLGLWPASNIEDAQRKLVERTLSFGVEALRVSPQEIKNVLEAGPGWGGARAIAYKIFANANYTGLNCSANQIAFAKKFNGSIPNTNYALGFFEDIDELNIDVCDVVFGVESFIHVKNKSDFIKSLRRRGMKHLILAEICSEQKDVVMQNPLFYPSLAETISTKEYSRILLECGAKDFEFCDLSMDVFLPWSDALATLNERDFAGNKRVLRQFKDSYRDLAVLAEQETVRYMLIAANF